MKFYILVKSARTISREFYLHCNLSLCEKVDLMAVDHTL